MAQKTTIEVTDDLDGSQADETVEFGLDGYDFILDLTAEHAREFRAVFADYVAVARRQPRNAAYGKQSKTGAPRMSREDSKSARAWGREKGWNISDFGRLPSSLVAAYNAEHKIR